MSVVTVSTTSALSLALQSAHSGDTILLAAGTYSGLSISSVNINGNVTIQSADVSHQATLTNFSISGSNGLTFSNLDLNSVAALDPYYGFRVTQSQNINFTNLNVHGSLDGNSANDACGFLITNSLNVSVTNSEFQQLERGIVASNSNDLTFSGNTMHDMRSDGIDCSGCSYVLVSQNKFTDFYPQGAVGTTGDHPDAIQFFTMNTTVSAHDITITGNTYTRGVGLAAQGVFLHDEVGSLPFLNVRIADNTIIGGMYNGIAVFGGHGLDVSGNTVQGYSDMESWVRVENADTVSVTNNQAQDFLYNHDANVSQSGNQLVGAATPGTATSTSNTGTTTTTTTTTTTASTPPAPEPDAVTSAVTYTLGTASHSLTLTGTANIDGTGNDNGDNITGNTGANHLTGGAGADTFADGGGAGADTMIGKTGNDTYYINNSGDVVVENAGEGSDAAYASVSWTLSANVEKLVLTGTANIDGTGNNSNDWLVGNSGANHLNGGSGDDSLDGGAGADTMSGGAGNDTYTVDNKSDSVVEGSGQGVDLVRSIVTYTLSANVENLLLLGNGATDGSGNGLANKITGNGAANKLVGGSGDDTINGGGGGDIITGGNGNNSLTGGVGNDTFRFQSHDGHDVITDFKANGDADRIDVSQILGRHTSMSIVDHGTYTTVGFSTGDSIDLLGVHATDVHLSGGYLI